MPILEDPQHENACQLRASGMTQVAAYAQAFEVPEDSEANNSSRFFRQEFIRFRVAEIKRRRAVLADLDDAWVLQRLKRIADSNLDDFFARDAAGKRLGISLAAVSRDKMGAVQEATVETVVEGDGEDAETVLRTKVKLEPRLAALELIGKWLNMWGPTKVALTDPSGEAPAEIVHRFRWLDPEPDPPDSQAA